MTLCFYFIGGGLAPCGALTVSSLLTSLVGLVSLFSTLSKAHLGYLQWVSTFLRCSISFWSSLGLLQTVFALWVRVFITLNLAESWWWLSHCRYCSIWVGFLYTVIDSLPSASGLTMVSKKGIAPSSLLFSTVNFMARSTLLMSWRKFFLLSYPLDNPCIIHIWETYFGGRVAVLSVFCSKYSM